MITKSHSVKQWNGSSAVDLFEHVQQFLNYYSLDGTELEIEPLMRRAVVAFKEESNKRVRKACDELCSHITKCFG